jgi:hypothetical protein
MCQNPLFISDLVIPTSEKQRTKKQKKISLRIENLSIGQLQVLGETTQLMEEAN